MKLEFTKVSPSGNMTILVWLKVKKDDNKFLNAYIKGAVDIIAEGYCYVSN